MTSAIRELLSFHVNLTSYDIHVLLFLFRLLTSHVCFHLESTVIYSIFILIDFVFHLPPKILPCESLNISEKPVKHKQLTKLLFTEWVWRSLLKWMTWQWSQIKNFLGWGYTSTTNQSLHLPTLRWRHSVPGLRSITNDISCFPECTACSLSKSLKVKTLQL